LEVVCNEIEPIEWGQGIPLKWNPVGHEYEQGVPVLVQRVLHHFLLQPQVGGATSDEGEDESAENDDEVSGEGEAPPPLEDEDRVVLGFEFLDWHGLP